MRHSIEKLVRLSVSLALLCASAASQASTYTLLELKALVNDTVTNAFSITSAGKAVGASWSATGVGHPAAWQISAGRSALLPLGRNLTVSAVALSMSDSGYVAGYSTDAAGRRHAFRTLPGLQITLPGDDPGTPAPASKFTTAFGVNSTGQIAVTSGVSSTSTYPFVWDPVNLFTRIGGGAGPAGGALTINGLGDTAGQIAATGGAGHAYVWTWLDGVGHVADVHPGVTQTQSVLVSLNDFDEAAGWLVSSGGVTTAGLWKPGGSFKPLGTLGGKSSAAYGLNSATSPVVVGQAQTAAGVWHAFVWTAAAGMHDLNTQIPSGTGWTLISANAVNAAGQIAGQGIYRGEHHGFVLTPVQPAPLTVSVSSAITPGGSSVAGTVLLAKPAPTGGTAVQLMSSDAHVPVPATVTVPAAHASVNFTIATKGVTVDTRSLITATTGTTRARAAIQLLSPLLAAFSTASPEIGGGLNGTGTVSLTCPSAAGPASIKLSSSNSQVLVMPATATVPAGKSSVSFSIQARSVKSDTDVTLTALYRSRKFTVTVRVTAPRLASLSISPSSVTGGQSAAGTVVMSAPVTTAVTVAISGGQSGVAIAPTSVTVGAGQSSASFLVTTYTVGSDTTVTFSAALGGLTASTSLVVLAPVTTTGPKITITFDATNYNGGDPVHGTVTIDAAQTTAITINLTSDNGDAVFNNTGSGSSSVTIPAGSTSATFDMSTLVPTASELITITGTYSTSTGSGSFTLN